MINSDKKGNERLPEFQKYLIDKKLVAESKTSFFAYWVSRYLAYARRQKAPVDDYQEQVVAVFLEGLRTDASIQDWQPRQAEDAIMLYYFNYLGKIGGQAVGISGITNVDNALRETKLLIRLKYYSYSTEAISPFSLQ